MRRLAPVIAGVLALAASQAQAATYSVTTTTTQETYVTVARTAFNASLPACATQAGCSSDPNYQATNGSYLLFIVTSAITSWAKLVQLKATIAPTDQSNAETLLNACITGNGLGGLTAAQCQTLLTEVQSATN